MIGSGEESPRSLRSEAERLRRREANLCGPFDGFPRWDPCQGEVEARAGIEPAHTGFADQCITTLLPRHARKRREGSGWRRVVKVKGEGGRGEFAVVGDCLLWFAVVTRGRRTPLIWETIANNSQLWQTIANGLASAGPRTDLSHGPSGMLRDQRVLILRRQLQRGEVLRPAGVAEGDADVAEEGGAFDALDGGFDEEGAEGVVGEREEVAEGVLE